MKKNVALLVILLGLILFATGVAFAQDKPDFSTKRGFFTDAFSLTLSIEDAAGSIRYTLDGSTPTTTTGAVYTTPLTISKTSTVRAIACYSDGTYSAVATNTYIFVADVITQCSDGKAPNTSWPTANSNSSRSQIIDYGMDPDIVNSATYSGLVDEALLAIPTLSLVTDLSNFFNSSTGIYMNASQDGDEWERPVSVELINPDGKDGFQIDCGIRIRGGMSRQYSNPKHAFRLFFRSEYGSSRLDYELFGNEGADSFDKVDLRTEQNYSWSKDGSTSNTMVREVWTRDTQGAMGDAYARSRYYHLYIDGIYWGIYQTEERPESSFAESYFGDDEANYDVMKVDSTTHEVGVNDGTIARWQSLWSAAVTGFTTDARYYSVQGKNSGGVTDSSYSKLLDIDNLIDYMTLIYYDGDLDAPISNCLQNSKPNNFYAIIDRVTPDGFSFIAHDGEWTLLKTTENRLGPYNVGTQLTQFNPQWLLQKLMSHPEFLMRFADRVQKHLYNGGALSAEKNEERFLKRANQIDSAIIAESARWGDAKSTTALTRANWVTAINYVTDTFFPARTAAFISQLRAKSWFPTIDAPSLLINGTASSGGVVETGDSLTMKSSSSYIYYTLDGTDPRVKVSVAKEEDLTSAAKAAGAISSSAILYNGAVAISDPTTRVLARAYSGSVWSALVDLRFITGDPVSNLRITEIMYNPAEDEDSEFIELQNVGGEDIGLAGISFTDGVLFNFTEGELAPGEYALLVRDQTVFETVYGTGFPVFGVFKGSLNNAGETLTCETSSGDVIQSFVFSDDWQTATDGGGYSLTFIDPTLSNLSAWSIGTNWKASSVLGGTPGAADSSSVKGPSAAFSASATSGDAPLSVTFTDSSAAGSSAITSWSWTFGDGAASTLQNPTHEYSVAGSYTVSLTVTTKDGLDTETKSGYIIVVELPTAAFSASETSGTAPLSVMFTDASTPGNSSITAWCWTFGDGSASSLQNPTHVYTTSGVYTVSLTVTTAVGVNMGLIEDYITVADPLTAPTAGFSAAETSGEVPFTVEFSDLSTSGSSEIVEWLWSFGDGWTSDAQHPTHIYSNAGVYTVSLTVTTEAGTDTDTKEEYITVIEPLVAPTAAFNVSTTSGTAPLTVAFTDASTEGNAAITSWLWTFGDGLTSTLKNPTHVYSDNGIFSVTLTVTSSAGSGAATKAACVTVTEEEGVGCFAGNTATVFAGDWFMLVCMAAGFAMTARRRSICAAIGEAAKHCEGRRLK
jgi:PKD repeat protein